VKPGCGIDSIIQHNYYVNFRSIVGGEAATRLPVEFEATKPSFSFGNEGEGRLLSF
jgi:hypothetical protein